MSRFKTPIVISGFPATGKSYLVENNPASYGYDSDSSEFSWLSEGVRNPEFPDNYMKRIKKLINRNIRQIICVSSHEIVRQALVDNNIHFQLVYPDISLKDEYLQRFKDRGDDDKFINFIYSNWDNFIIQLKNQKGCYHHVLSSGQYMNDIIHLIE